MHCFSTLRQTDFISLHSSVLDVTVKLYPDKYKFQSYLTESTQHVRFEFLILASAYPDCRGSRFFQASLSIG